MAEKNSNAQISFGIQGMERASFAHLLNEKVFSFARNSNIETDTESIALTNEHSNLLCSRFKPGYIVIGTKFDSLNSRLIFFLTQKESRLKVDSNDNPILDLNGDRQYIRNSEIGFIKINEGITDESDLDLDCGCDMKSILAEPLENTTQVAYCTYTPMLMDDCNNCLNFDPNYPVHNVILKQEACGYTMSFASKNNPYRYIIMDKLDYYTYTGDTQCGDTSQVIPTCLDCEKLRVFPRYEQPYIYPEVINFGGNLKRGEYEFYIAYCDKLGNELTSYVSATNPVPVFDPTNIQLEQKTQYSESNYAIKLKVENLDRKFNFYKVAVIEKTDVSETTAAFEEGIHSVTDVNITYTSNGTQSGRRISLNRLFLEKPVYKHFGGIVASNGMMFGYDYEVEKEWNLQPVVNLLGSFLKWQTVESTENLYEDGVNVAMYKGYMRDEVYPFGIRFITNDGYKTAVYPMMGRPSLSNDTIPYSPTFNRDIKSVLENTPKCGSSDRKYKWQFYNTGLVLGDSYSDMTIEDGVIVNKNVEEDCIQEGVKVITNGEVEVEIDNDFYNLREWVYEHGSDICDPLSEYYNLVLCGYITDENPTECDYSDIFTFPICEDEDDCRAKYCDTSSPYFDAVLCEYINKRCKDGKCSGICNDVEKVDSNLYISTIVNEKVEFTEKIYPWVVSDKPKYEHNSSTTQCVTDLNYPPLALKTDLFLMSDNSVSGSFSGELLGVTTYFDRAEIADNLVCTKAMQLPAIGQAIPSEMTGNINIEEGFTDKPVKARVVFKTKYNIKGYPEFPADYVYSKDSLLSDILAPTTGGFESRLLKTALWYKIEFPDNEEFLFEITPVVKSDKCVEDTSTGDGMVRYVIFDKCKNGTILQTGTYNANDGLFLLLKKADFGKKEVFLTLDTKIKEFVKTTDYGMNGGIRVIRDSFFFTSTICGCFDIVRRPKEYYKIKSTFDSLQVDKKTTYSAKCFFNASKEADCGVIPHKYGMFSYWESGEKYPDNSELYNSSDVRLNMLDLKHEDTELINLFQSKYVQNADKNGNNIWKTDPLKDDKSTVDFTCEPIRHFKFPDNRVIPFMTTESLLDFGESKIYPIGITIDENTVNVFLDSAVKTGLIDQEQRNRITGYEIYRGDRTVNKSIVMKGILNDMYKDTRDSNSTQDMYFRNFPYNSLGKNQFITEDKERNNLLSHPFGSLSNDRFSFISPEVYYSRPKAPYEMSVDGYMYGNAMSKFVDVKDHSEWVILGEKAYSLAKKLAIAEILTETALNIATLTVESSKNFWLVIGLGSTGGNPIGTGTSIAATAIYLAIESLNLATFKLPKLTTQWLEIFEQRGSVNNYASMYVSQKGMYNYFRPNEQAGDMLRGLVTSKYLSNGIDVTTEVKGNSARITSINNKDRESSIYVYTGNYDIKYPTQYQTYDNVDVSSRNSSRTISSEDRCSSDTQIKRIASPYVTLKNYMPEQYGKIDEIKWLSLNHNSKIKLESKNIFGGDIYISRVDFKNKVKLFNANAVGLANRVPFKYSKQSNLGYTRFYVDHKSADEAIGSNDMPYLSSEYNMDCRTGGRKFYEGAPSKFYLYAYGVPYFLTESEINSNYRYAGTEYHEQFASRGLNVEEWVQEKNVSIAYDNLFFYNSVYSRNQTGLPTRILPTYYEREKWDCLSEAENGVAWSEPDNSEVSLSDPWLVFKPFNIYRFPFSYGKLISLNAIESTQVMGRFADNMAVFNAVDVLRDRITPENEDLGTGGVFAQRPIQFSFTELGETGSQHRSMVSTEFGHFWVDAKRGKVFQLQPNAKGLNAISDFKAKGEESGMRKWFKRHLPFKILKSNIKNIGETDLDNTYKGLGIVTWWDSRFKRVFITKKDYIPKSKCIEFSNGDFYLNQTLCSGVPQVRKCSLGYTYNSVTGLCEKIENTSLCRPGFAYDPVSNQCVSDIQNTCSNGLDIVFIIDSTGSQGGAINAIKNSISETIVPAIVEKFGSEYRLGLISVKDNRSDSLGLFDILEPMSLSNEAGFYSAISAISATGGYNTPEPTDMALEAVLNNTATINFKGEVIPSLPAKIGEFRENVEKIIIMITDTFPSGLIDDYNNDIWLNVKRLTESASDKGVKIFSYLTSSYEDGIQPPIAPSTPPNEVYIMNNYANVTGGKYYFCPGGSNISQNVIDGIITNTDCDEVEDPICKTGCTIVGSQCRCLLTKEPTYSDEIIKIELTDTRYFKDASWTVAYSPIYQTWISYYDFKPDYAIAMNDYFQTGLNYSNDSKEVGLWSHLLTNKSYQVFYGKRYPWEIEIPIKNTYTNNILQDLKIWTISQRYHDNFDYAVWRKKSFNKLVVYNQTNNSGLLHLNYDDSMNKSKYPKQISSTEQGIQASHVDESLNINYFYNRVRKEENHVPIWNSDENEINKTLDSRVISFNSKRVLERLRGDWFIVRMIQDSESRFKQYFKFMVSKEQGY